ncbi:MAG TPA: hypothetical protein VK772_08605 [Puia sp.]|jgi:hypothetical protein|nr:hypothetical protein [Puia sp.]
MERSIFLKVDATIICLVLLIIMPIVVKLGNRMRKRFWGPEEADTKGGVNSLLGALFGLWGFILAFTFGQSGVRFENLRSMIVDEANYLRTAIIRADLFPDSVRNVYRAELQQYLEERISYYDNAGDEIKMRKNNEEISKTSAAIWATTVASVKKPEIRTISEAMAASLINLFDIGAKREALLTAGIPAPVSISLILLALSICFVGGFTTPVIKNKEWIVIFAFAFLAAMILYITIDLARPMEGLIRPDAGQASIISLRRYF